MAIVKKYKAEITDIKNSAENIFSIEFKSLNGIFKFSPGQFLHLALDEYDPSMGWPESRCFSIQTSPAESNIKITFAVKGKFTNRMAETLKKGSEVMLKLPYGDLFIREHNKLKTVFIAGGTGITPFLSLFTDNSFKHYMTPKLYFGLRSKRYNIYLNELEEAVKNNNQFKINIIYQDKEGQLDINKIYEECGFNSAYFISGPPDMINSFKLFLLGKNVPKNNILTDEWE
jgi:ferredoxin-NADP reductase